MLARLPPAFLSTASMGTERLPRLRLEAHDLLALLVAEAGLPGEPDDAPAVGDDARRIGARRHLLVLFHVLGRNGRDGEPGQRSPPPSATRVRLFSKAASPVLNSRRKSAADHRHALDFDQHPGRAKFDTVISALAGKLPPGKNPARISTNLSPSRTIVDEHRHGHHVGEAAAAVLQRLVEQAEDGADLRLEISRDVLALLVLRRGLAGEPDVLPPWVMTAGE